MKLLGKANTKTMKGEKYGYLTYILHLAPSTLSGYNTCPKASVSCAAVCLNTAGMGIFSNVQSARIRKTKEYFENKVEFETQLDKDIQAAKRQAAKVGKKLAIRINGTSDLPALAMKMAKLNSDVQFYDYTKVAKSLERNDLPNYHLTFSRSENNSIEVMSVLEKGFSAAVVFAGELPKTYLGYEVISGEESDLRFLDKKNVVVGLVAKGKAKKETSGFVVR